jgi:hypothetical protein
MTMPNFLIIGAGKAGTTSIYHYLRQHPDIYMSPLKETNFFACETSSGSGFSQPVSSANGTSFPISSLETYRQLFQGVGNQQAIGEASPLYMSLPGVAGRIKQCLPHARLMAILRDPVERAYSSYLMHVRDGREKRTFLQAIRDEARETFDSKLVFGQRHYMRIGFYYQSLQPYFNLFDQNQIAVYLFEDLKNDARGLLRKMFNFLGVFDEFIPDVSIRYNVSGHPKNKMWQPLLGKSPLTRTIRHILPTRLAQPVIALQETLRGRQFVKPPLAPEIRSTLIAGYREDVLQLQTLIQRDLSSWLE